MLNYKTDYRRVVVTLLTDNNKKKLVEINLVYTKLWQQWVMKFISRAYEEYA